MLHMAGPSDLSLELKAPELSQGFSGSSDGKESACRIPGFSPWVRKIPWRRAWQPIPVFLPGEARGQEERQEDRGSWQLQSMGVTCTFSNLFLTL